MRFTILLIIFLSCSQISQGQIPGYMGKKILLDVNIGGMPNLNGGFFMQNISGLYDNPPSYAHLNMNTGKGFMVGFCVSRKLVVKFNYKTKNKKYYIPTVGIVDYSNSSFFNELYYVEDEGVAIVNTKRFSLGVQKFLFDAVAPVGKYIEFGIAVNKTNLLPETPLKTGTGVYEILLDEDGYEEFSYLTVSNPSSFSANSVTLSTIYAGIGNRRVLGNLFYVDFRVLLYLPLSYKFIEDVEGQGATESRFQFENQSYYWGDLYEIDSSYDFYKDYKINPKQTYLDDRLRKFQYINELAEVKLSFGILF